MTDNTKRIVRIVRILILVSGIIIATPLLIVCLILWVEFIREIFTDPKASLVLLAVTAVLSGYIGLWSSLVSPKRKTRNSVLLSLGICGILLGFILDKGAAKSALSFKNPVESLIALWPLAVATIFLVLNISAIRNKKAAIKQEYKD